MQRPPRSALRDQDHPHQQHYGSFSSLPDQEDTPRSGAAGQRDPSVASRVTFSAPPSPTRILQYEEPDSYEDYVTAAYPTMQQFRQRMLLGIVSSLILLLLVIFAFALCISDASSLMVTPIFLGATAYLSSDALRAHFVYQLIDSDNLIVVGHAILQEALRLPATLLAINTVDPTDNLTQVAAVATGVAWGMAFMESTLRLWTLWQETQLYVDVLPASTPAPTQTNKLAPRALEEGDNITSFLRSDHPQPEPGQSVPSEDGSSEEENYTEVFLDASVRERDRLELEDRLGMPLFALPSFLLPLWSLNSFILSLALSLIVATIPTSIPLNLIKALSVTWCVRIIVALGWAKGTSKFGLAAVSYVSLLGYCALCLAALGVFGIIH